MFFIISRYFIESVELDQTCEHWSSTNDEYKNILYDMQIFGLVQIQKMISEIRIFSIIYLLIELHLRLILISALSNLPMTINFQVHFLVCNSLLTQLRSKSSIKALCSFSQPFKIH